MTLDRLYRDVEDLKQQYKGLAGGPQLALSSIENGAIDSMDADGNLKMTIGQQDDGGNTINVISGPTPPTPVGFIVDVDHGKFIVHWSGDFDGDKLAPSDWSRAEVHASQDPFFVPSRATARGSIVSAAGGEVTIGVLKGTWTIKMLAWSQAGKMSAPSAPVDVEVPGYGDIVLTEIDAAETEIKNGNSILVNAQDTLGGKLDSAFGQLDGINDDLSNLDEALQGAVASANGKNTVHFDDRAPTAADEGVAGDTWFVGQVGREEEEVLARNLWRSSKMSVHRGMTSAASITATPVEDGLELEATSTAPSGAYSLIYTQTAYRVRVEANSRYSWAIPIRNTGDKVFPVRINSWIEASGTPLGYASKDLEPGETWLAKMEDMDSADNGVDIRFSLYYGANSPKPEVGAKIVMLDGITLVQASTAVDPFNGDTADGEGYDDPRYRWVGEPAESESEMYLAPTEDLSQAWNVTAEYRHDGTDWVQVELSHNVISSVDIGALTVGSAAIKEAVVERLFAEVVVARMSVADEFIGENAILTGAVTAPKITASEELWAKLAQFVTVYAEMVDSDVFNGRVFRGSTFLTTNDSRWSDAGLFLNDVDGSPRIQAPTDGSDFTVNAEVVAKSLTATGRASFLSDNNRLEPGAGLVLAAGVGDPPSPPVMSTYWPTIKPPALEGEETVSGLAYGDGLFWRAVDAGSGNNDLDRIEGIDRAGVVQKTIPLVDFWARNGLTVIGDEIFALGIRDDLPESTRNSSRWVRVFGLDGTYKRQWEYTEYGTGTYHPGIGRDDAGNLVIAQCWKEGDLTWRTYNKTTGALLAEVDRDDATKSDITGAYIGNGDLGAKHAFVAKKSTSTIQVFATDGAATSESWYTAAREEPLGLAWDGTKFHTLNTAGGIYEYGGPNMGDGTNEWWAVYRWATVVDGQLDLSSRISPPARFPWPRRAQLKVGAPNLPEGADSIAPSLAHKPGTPSRTDFHSPAWGYTEGEPSAHYYELPTDWETYSTPPDSNNFPDGDPSALEAASGLFEVKGDGSGRWGPLTFNTDGTMSSNAVPDWIPVTTFRTGFAPQTWGHVPAYRIWPDGKVEWRGVIAGSVTTTVAAFEVPAAARPPQPVNLVAATNTPGGEDATTRIEFGQLNEPDIMRIYRGAADRTWVSIDGAYYYLE